MSVNISAPDFLAYFRSKASKSFTEGTKNKEDADVAAWFNKNINKLVVSLETTTDASKSVVVTSLPPQGCMTVLNEICAPTTVNATPRAGTKDFVVIFTFKPTFGTWREGTSVPALAEKIRPCLNKWEERLIEKWTNPIMEALEKGEKSVTFSQYPPEWIQKLFEVPEFELKMEELNGIGNTQVTIVPKKDPLTGLPASFISERTLEQLKEEEQ